MSTSNSSTALLERDYDGVVNETDPAARPRRRAFSPEYKLAVLEAYDALTEPGAKGALLRREGLYSSHIVEWRRARDVGALTGLAAQARQRRSPERVELCRLRKRTKRLESELARTKLALEIVGKAHALLGLISESADSDPRLTK
jgi:transposase-like protein